MSLQRLQPTGLEALAAGRPRIRLPLRLPCHGAVLDTLRRTHLAAYHGAPGHGAASFFGRGSRRSEALHVLVLLASMCHFLSHSSDLWPNPRVWMSCLFSWDLADTLRLVASLLVVVRCFKDPLGPSQWDLSEHFSPTVAAVAAAMAFWLLAWLARWLCTSITFEVLMFQQHHFFNAVCIVANTILALLCFVTLSAENRQKHGKLQMHKHSELILRPIALRNLLLQLLWCSLVGAHLCMGIVQPGSFSQWSFLANILKTSAGP